MIVVVLAHASDEIFAIRGVVKYLYISAAQAIGSDLSAGYIFPDVQEDGSPGTDKLTAARITASLQAHLRAASLPTHFTMYFG